MESDDENDGFPKQGGEALEIGDEFDSEEEADQMPGASNDAMRQPMKANIAASSSAAGAGAAKAGDVKGAKVENQPFDIAVDVNDSEEIDSDEEEDEVNVDVNVQAQAQKQKKAQSTQQDLQQQMA
jgi:hypothetical protein